MMLAIGNIPIRGLAAVFGGFLLQFTMGAFYSFGNMSTYMTSYMRKHGNPDITSFDFVIVQSTWGMTQGCVMPLSGFLIRAIGEKASMISGSILFSAGCALTYFTINKELWMVAATYGFVSAFGQNIALIPTLTTGMKWFPNRKGLAMGCVVGGFGGGALVFNYIQTAILNPENVSPDASGPDEGYFTNEDLLNRVPNLLLTLAGIYLGLGMIACLLITQPPNDWLDQFSDDKTGKLDEEYVTPLEAFTRYEFYLLWFTRLCVVMLSNVISAYYKTFGQTFIRDDMFLSIVGSVTSVFNCSGRLFYGLIMDRFAYKVSMSIEAVLLIILMSTFYLTSMIGVSDPESILLCDNNTMLENVTSMVSDVSTTTFSNITTLDCDPDNIPTSLTTKIVYALWVWAIYFTFPGTYSTQPAVTTQTFGHKYGGFIYAFLFSSDIINNLLVATLSKEIKDNYGWLGLFGIISVNGVVALIATLLFPYEPKPGPRPNPAKFQIPFLERLGLVEIQKSSEQEINLGFNTEIEEKMQINKEERNKKYDL